MGRQFSFKHNQSLLRICVRPIDEAWNLWICEAGCRLALGATVSIDEAMDARRSGEDAIVAATEKIRRQIEAGGLAIASPLTSTDQCPAS